jgi:hypothetical protein
VAEEEEPMSKFKEEIAAKIIKKLPLKNLKFLEKVKKQ